MATIINTGYWKITDVGSNIDNTVFDDWVTAYGDGTIRVNNEDIIGYNMNGQPWQGSIEEQLLYNGASQSDIDLVNRMPICVYDPSLAQNVTLCNNPDDFVSIPHSCDTRGDNNYLYYAVYHISSGVMRMVGMFYVGYPTITVNSEAYIVNEYCGCGYDTNWSCTDAGSGSVLR